MPKFPKGSAEMKQYMKDMRSKRTSKVVDSKVLDTKIVDLQKIIDTPVMIHINDDKQGGYLVEDDKSGGGIDYSKTNSHVAGSGPQMRLNLVRGDLYDHPKEGGSFMLPEANTRYGGGIKF